MDRIVMNSAECGGVGAVAAFRDLWNSIHGPGAWKKNPWVWVVSFKRIQPEGA